MRLSMYQEIELMGDEGPARLPTSTVQPKAAIQHGKLSTYQKHGCRCSPCTAANYASTKKYAERRKAAA